MSKKILLKIYTASLNDENSLPNGDTLESQKSQEDRSFWEHSPLDSLPSSEPNPSPVPSSTYHSFMTDNHPTPIVISDSSDYDSSPRKKPKLNEREATSQQCISIKAETESELDDVETGTEMSMPCNSTEIVGKRLFYDSDSNSDSLPSLSNRTSIVADTCTARFSLMDFDTDDDSDITNTYTVEDSPTNSNIENEFSEHYENDYFLPIYKPLASGVKTKEAVQLLLRKLSIEQLSRNIPHEINQNVSFVYSVNHIGHWKNALCDGMGKWNQVGTETCFVNITDGISLTTDRNTTKSPLKVIRRKYRNGACDSLHRIVILLENVETGDILNQIFVQYYFNGAERTVTVAAHGNSKDMTTQYQRTSESTKERIKDLCSMKKKPKDIFHSVLEEQGGIEHAKSRSSIPKGRQQINNFKRASTASSSDPLVECTDLAKQQEHKEERFVRDVRSAPEFSIFLASNRQLQEVEKFCTNNKNFSVLGVDTTFNIGEYYITIATYRHLMLETARHVEPVMIGPILLHQRKTFDSYFKLASTMLQENSKLRNVKVFGTDGDTNLSDALHVCFSDAKHLLCDIHMVDNVRQKLSGLNIKGTEATNFMTDIFGKETGDLKIPGLVDCMTATEFDTRLEQLSPEWEARHAAGQSFLNYFIEFKAELIKQCMTADLRSMCGLGFPPKPYTQNANECMNSVIKSDAKTKDTKNTDPYDFVKLVEKTIKRQENEVKLSLIGCGEYRLKDEYRHLKVKEETFWRKSEQQRASVFKRMMAEPLTSMVASDEVTSIRCTNSHKLTVTAQSSEIVKVPYRILTSIFEEAAEVLDNTSGIVPVPGQEGGAFFVLDVNKKASEPRLVKVNKKTNNVTCDGKCHRWNSYKFCSHMVALAEQLGILSKVTEKYRKSQCHVNVTKMANTNMPAGRGKKGTKATQIRKGAANKRNQVTVDYVHERVRNEPRDRVRDEPRDRIRDEPRDRVRDEPRDMVRDEPRDRVRDEPRHRVRDEPRDGVRDEPRDRVRDEPRDRVRDEPRDRVRNEPRNRVHDEPRDRVCDEPRQVFHVTFIAGLVKKCYGCGQEFTHKYRTPPNDVLLKTFDYRVYVSPKSKTKKTTQTQQNTYYHLNVDCVRRNYPHFELRHVVIHDEMYEQLTEGHKSLLRRNKMYN